MYRSDGVTRIVDELEILEAERRQLHQRGPHFKIVYRRREAPGVRGAHRDVVAVLLIHAGKSFQVRLGTMLLLLFDFLARHRQLALTARQIEHDTFQSGTVANPKVQKARGILRAYVRVYVERIRAALRCTFEDAGLDIEPEAVLATEETATNEAGYRLRATVELLATAA